jgi:gliding motility-associated-like protein
MKTTISKSSILFSKDYLSNLKASYLLLFFLSPLFFPLFAQPACPGVSVTPASSNICSGCRTLTATVQGTVATTSYSVAPTPYVPYPFNSGTPVLVDIDDTWTDVINLPFCFQFYGNTYTQVVIGSNGIITFDLSTVNAFCEWDLTAAGPIPTTSLQKNSIMGPYHDIDPTNQGSIYWQVTGAAPCRALIVSFYQVPYFGDPNSVSTDSCPDPLFATHQIVFYETTNIIDIYIQNKPVCMGWNDGLAIEGIHNSTGTAAVTVPGRNNTVWTATNDGQRFTPTGAPQYNLTWYASPNNTVIGTGSTVSVCPTATTTYTATVVNNTCSGPITATATATVAVGGSPPTMASTPASCTGNTGTATATPSGGTPPYSYLWSPSGQTTQTATGLAPGTHTVTVSSTGTPCVSTNTVIVSSPAITPTFSPVASICSGGTLAALPTTSINGITGTWSPAINNTATTTYTFTPTSGQCASTTTLSIAITPGVSPTFTAVPPICSGGFLAALPTTSTNGITGSWSPAINNTATTTYTFTPTTGQCANTAPLSITVTPSASPTFAAIAPLCVGETPPSLPVSSIEAITGTWIPAVINNLASGNYAFTPNAGQCATNGSLAVTVQSELDFEILGNCAGSDFILEVAALNNSFDINTANFSWFNNAGQQLAGNSNYFNVTQYLISTEVNEDFPITFSVTVSTPNGCITSKPITLNDIFCGIQRGISVNNDNYNDFFDLQLFDIKNLSIFNRYGLKVYSKGQYKDEWRGQSDKGDELPDGTYYYVIDFNSGGDSKTGWIYKNTEN